MLPSDVLMSSPIIQGDSGGGVSHFTEFGGIDPTMDPEMAAVSGHGRCSYAHREHCVDLPSPLPTHRPSPFVPLPESDRSLAVLLLSPCLAVW